MGKYYLGLQSGLQTNFSVVDGSGVISDLDLSGLYLSVTGKAADSDLLDGQDSAYYRDAANITGLARLSGYFTGDFTGYARLDSIQFNTGTTGAATTAQGELEWADDLGTLKLGLKGGNIVHYVGQQLFERVTNKTTGTLAKGTVVYVSGAQGNRITVEKAIATADTTSATVFGVVAETIAPDAEGFVTQDGLLQGLNTTGFAEGAVLWLSPTVSGAFTETKPIAPDHLVMVGFCVRAHQSAGEILVKVQNGYEINELHNVRLTGETNGQILAYNSTSGVWYNADLTGGANISVTSNGGPSITIATTSGSYTGSFIGTASNADLLDNQDGSYYLNVANITGALTSGQSLLLGDGSGRFANAIIGSGLLLTGNTLHATGAGGGGGDADTLNGQAGAYYLNYANFTGTPQVSGSFTGTLTGTASNADLLDNLDSTYFRDATNLTGAINATQLSGQTSAYYLNLANITGTAQLSGSFTGTLTGTASNADLLDNLDSTYFRDGANLTGTINATQLGGQSSAYYRNAANISGTAQLTGSFTGLFSGNLTGTASNADFLDGLDSTYFRNGSNLTGTVNATQLNSQAAAFYLNYANLTGTPRVSGLFTGTLTGTASNADFLDNLDSTYFRNAANLSGTAQLSGSFTGAFSGNLTGTASNADFLDSLDSTYFRNAANLTGTASLSGTFSGIFRSNASTTGSASINLPHGTAPTSPVNGDIWTTTSGIYVQVNGATVGPLSTGGGGGGGQNSQDDYSRTIALIGL